MESISSIYVPVESVNDQIVTLTSLKCQNGDFIKKNTLIAEVETSKAILEIFSEVEGYVKIYVEEKADIAVGVKMFDFFNEPVTSSIMTNILDENKIKAIEIEPNSITKYPFISNLKMWVHSLLNFSNLIQLKNSLMLLNSKFLTVNQKEN